MSKRKPFLIYISCFFIVFLTFGQESESKRTHFINVGYDKTDDSKFFSGGYKLAFTEFGHFASNFSAITYDMKLSLSNNQTLIAPSLTYNFYGIFYFVGINTTYFFGACQNDFRIAPQVGITYYNVLNFGYAYYLPVSLNNEISLVGRNSFFMTLSWPISRENQKNQKRKH